MQRERGGDRLRAARPQPARLRQHRRYPVLQGLQHHRLPRDQGDLRRNRHPADRQRALHEDDQARSGRALGRLHRLGRDLGLQGRRQLGRDRRPPAARHLFARRARRQPLGAVRQDRGGGNRHRPAAPCGRGDQHHHLLGRQSDREAGEGRHLHRRRGAAAHLPARLGLLGRLVPDQDRRRDRPARGPERGQPVRGGRHGPLLAGHA